MFFIDLYKIMSVQLKLNSQSIPIEYLPSEICLSSTTNPLRSFKREGPGCQLGYSLYHLIPELEHRVWVLKDHEVFCRVRQDNIVCG